MARPRRYVGRVGIVRIRVNDVRLVCRVKRIHELGERGWALVPFECGAGWRRRTGDGSNGWERHRVDQPT